MAGRPKTIYKNLPPRMRARRLKNGDLLYYYGKDKIPLGGCLVKATHRWAEIEAGRPMDADVLLSEASILNRCIPLTPVAGVYFLVCDNQIKYVGQTRNLFKRIEEHRLRRKFDAYALIPCAPQEAPVLEQRYIRSLRPEWNF